MAANVAKRLWEVDDIWTWRTQGMMEILGALVLIGVFVFIVRCHGFMEYCAEQD